MNVVIWIILAYIFIKCVGLVIKPFIPEKQETEEYYPEPVNQTTVNINIRDSFNTHTSNSYYKGGDHYGSSIQEKESSNNPYVEGTSYYDIYRDAIEDARNKRYRR